MDTPLTKEEAAFAAENHNLVYAFLRRKGYFVDDYYDIAIFGYLRAVREWHTREELREKYEFSTIAFTAMRTDMFRHFQSENRKKLRAIEFSLDKERDTRAVEYKDVLDNVIRIDAVHKAMTMLSPRQREVARLKAAGLSNREISERYGVTPEMIRQDMVKARAKIMRSSAFVPEIMAA